MYQVLLELVAGCVFTLVKTDVLFLLWKEHGFKIPLIGKNKNFLKN